MSSGTKELTWSAKPSALAYSMTSAVAAMSMSALSPRFGFSTFHLPFNQLRLWKGVTLISLIEKREYIPLCRGEEDQIKDLSNLGLSL